MRNETVPPSPDRHSASAKQWLVDGVLSGAKRRLLGSNRAVIVGVHQIEVRQLLAHDRLQTAEDGRCCVARRELRANRCAEGRRVVEVDQQPTRANAEDVARLEIAVHDPLIVELLEVATTTSAIHTFKSSRERPFRREC